MGLTVTVWEWEYKCHLYLGKIEKPAIAQHGWSTGHTIRFEETFEKLWRSIYVQNSMNKEDGTNLSKACLPAYFLVRLIVLSYSWENWEWQVPPLDEFKEIDQSGNCLPTQWKLETHRPYLRLLCIVPPILMKAGVWSDWKLECL